MGGGRMNKLIIGITLGLLISTPLFAKNIINPFERIDRHNGFNISTTKITTEEGTYRIFMADEQNGYGKGVGITAVKIK